MELKLSNISKIYGQKRAVDELNFTFLNGVYALLGANGSGKTTLMRMLVSVLNPTSGTITLDGNDISRLDGEYRNLLGYLPQNFGYYKDFTAMDFLLYMCSLKGIDSKIAKEKCLELLEYVDLSDVAKKKLKTFSGGMRQRIGIAQALLNDPKILVLDEPTAGLDPKERIRFRNLLSKVSKDKIVIYATHIVSDISYIADNVLIMKDGKIITDGTIKALLDEMKGAVWLCEAEPNILDSLQERFIVGNISTLENGKISVRIISKNRPNENAVAVMPELEDVYLYHFGEVSKHDDND